MGYAQRVDLCPLHLQADIHVAWWRLNFAGSSAGKPAGAPYRNSAVVRSRLTGAFHLFIAVLQSSTRKANTKTSTRHTRHLLQSSTCEHAGEARRYYY